MSRSRSRSRSKAGTGPEQRGPLDGASRREFFAGAVRWLALGGLAAAGFLLARRTGSEFACINNRLCGDCPYGGNCPLQEDTAPAPPSNKERTTWLKKRRN